MIRIIKRMTKSISSEPICHMKEYGKRKWEKEETKTFI